MSQPISAATRLIALLGDPVVHSLSPSFQNAAIHAGGLDARYLAIRVADEAVGSLMLGLAAGGCAGNVTVPHKRRAAAAVQKPSDAVRFTGACNTFWMAGGELHGDNTDVVGFVRAATSLLGAPLAGSHVLLLGAGGAARGVAYALATEGTKTVTIVNRTADRAAAVARQFENLDCEFTLAAAEQLPGQHFDLVVNATSIGLDTSAGEVPLDERYEPDFSHALDLVYAPGRTRWVNRLRERGVSVEDGLEMLVQQGAASFRHWFGIDPSLEAMRAALPAR